jgi:hypothetical protein
MQDRCAINRPGSYQAGWSLNCDALALFSRKGGTPWAKVESSNPLSTADDMAWRRGDLITYIKSWNDHIDQPIERNPSSGIHGDTNQPWVSTDQCMHQQLARPHPPAATFTRWGNVMGGKCDCKVAIAHTSTSRHIYSLVEKEPFGFLL